MFDSVDQNILRLDISVGNREHVEVVEPSEYLVGINFDEERVDFFLLNDLVEVIRKVVHNDV